MRKYSGQFPVVRIERISRSIFKLAFNSPEIASVSRPGQFVQIKTSCDYYPLWPRPFSIYDIDRARGEFEIIFKIFGPGTSQLASLKKRDKVRIFGPLGNGFDLLKGNSRVVMAGGGVGVPPLYFLSKESIANGYSAEKITFISGARTKDEHFDDGKVAALGADLRICTDDGSLGTEGTVVDILQSEIRKKRNNMVYACGPSAMLEKIDNILIERKIPGLLSLEALMPCGMGICSGCAVKTRPSKDRGPTDDRREYHLKRVCVDGPVFGIGEVIWK